MTTRISVVLPVYDREAYVAEALASVLGQSRPPDEVIVVDDGSTDGSIAAVQSLGSPIVRIVRRTNGGIGAARNTGLDHATGDVIAFIDSDDLWEPDKLAMQERILASRPDIALVFTHIVEFLTPEHAKDLAATYRARPRSVPGLTATTCVARRSGIDRIGPFDTGLRVGEFVDWLSRARDLGLQSLTLPETLARRRVHGRNTVLRESNRDYLLALKRNLDRRRAKAAHGG